MRILVGFLKKWSTIHRAAQAIPTRPLLPNFYENTREEIVWSYSAPVKLSCVMSIKIHAAQKMTIALEIRPSPVCLKGLKLTKYRQKSEIQTFLICIRVGPEAPFCARKYRGSRYKVLPYRLYKVQ